MDCDEDGEMSRKTKKVKEVDVVGEDLGKLTIRFGE